ncbi:MAG: phospholipid carrier-dependent glycosyltransferase [Deltaproteobacteria bacterium]|nr:phospholipid carrier-dependent glycosyltransferase [Candidatus Zymogenaceae bacterium]
MKKTKLISEKTLILLALILYVIVYFSPLGIRPMISPDEPRYAEIAREMIDSSDWITAHLDGVRYLEKPVMGFWWIAIAMKVFGVNGFSARFPSALAAGLVGLLLFSLVRRKTGDRYGGLLASVIFLTFGMVYVLGTSCIPDTVFTLFVTATLTFFYFSHQQERFSKKLLFLSLAGVFFGLGFLTKGLVALVIVVLAVTPFMIWERRFIELLKLFWIPLVAAAVVALPWSILIHLTNSDFWHYFIWTSHIERFVGGSASTNLHSEPFWYYLPILLGGTAPWIILLPSVISGVKREDFTKPIFRFTLCWLIFPLLFFSVSSGKLGTYILPLLPAVAILFTIGLHSYIKSGHNKSFSYSTAFLGAVMWITLLYLIVSFFIHDPKFALFSRDELPKRVGAFVCVGLWMILLIRLYGAKKLKTAVFTFALAPLFLLVSSPLIFPDVVKEHKIPDGFYTEYCQNIEPDAMVLGYKHSAYVAAWYLKRDDIYFYINPGVLKYALAHDDQMDRVIDIDEFPVIVEEKSRTTPVYLFLNGYQYDRYLDKLPEPASIDIYGIFLILKF